MEEDLDKAVFLYLKKKGFTQTEQIFQQEQQNKNNKNSTDVDADITKQILSFSQYSLYPLFTFFSITKLLVNYFLCLFIFNNF